MPAIRFRDFESAAAPAKGKDAAGGTGAVDLRIAADQAWLRDPRTTYPVTLDPQVELDPTSDTIVRNNELSTSGKPDHSGADYLAYGKATSYLARSFMQWPAAQLAGARITSATLSLWNWYSGSCSQTGRLVWSTTPYTNPIWWDTAPKLLSNDGYSTQTAGFSSACNDAWVSASVVPLFQRAANTSASTVYMGLTSYNESNPSLSWKQVRSLQAPNTALLTDQILAHHAGLTGTQQRVLALHSVSLRAMIIKNQQRRNGTGQLLGWTTDVNLNTHPTSLMNTESLAVNALALGAGAKHVYSPGQAPAADDRREPLQPHLGRHPHDLRAEPHSRPRHLQRGFVLRSRNPISGTRVANLDVYDARSNSIVGEQAVNAAQFLSDGTYDRFVRVTVPITITSADNSLEFRVWWDGGSSPLEVAEIRVR